VLESRLAFFPFAGETTTPRDFGLAFEARTIATADGERLRAWLIRPEKPRAFVVYFHGNGGNLSNWAPIVAGVARQGFAILAVDYRGYGLSTGRPSERGLHRDVDAVIDYVWTQLRPAPPAPPASPSPPAPPALPALPALPAPVIYWGRSLGVSMAAYASTRQPPAGLILESGFPDVRSLLGASPMALLALFSSYRFPAAAHLRGSQVPVLVMHGDADSVVPYDRGRALYDRLTGPKEFFTIAGADHNDAVPPDPATYWRTVNAFIERL
jgi:fermentation-respiration switch protein FrsA (DUF1100 family)